MPNPMTPADQFQCKCKRWAFPQCSQRATQEDALCDECRDHCSTPAPPGGLWQLRDEENKHPIPLGDIAEPTQFHIL